MAKRTCSIEGCERQSRARGWCDPHYKRWLHHGSTDDPRPTTVERFWAKVDRRGDNECWLWTATLNSRGYSQFQYDHRVGLGHRFAYELLVGPIPDGLQIDHLCRTPACVNPAHLEPVTNRENSRRGYRATKTHCPQGHPYSGDNLIIRHSGRSCRICVNIKQNQRRQRMKSVKLPDL